mmetsp:Transcript_12256/g.35955  ORF Transcript_12256/g.35955 Transcript_12256/m.35955 type:complete len:303 (+) Transcript_12256:493-1401(+)
MYWAAASVATTGLERLSSFFLFLERPLRSISLFIGSEDVALLLAAFEGVASAKSPKSSSSSPTDGLAAALPLAAPPIMTLTPPTPPPIGCCIPPIACCIPPITPPPPPITFIPGCPCWPILMLLNMLFMAPTLPAPPPAPAPKASNCAFGCCWAAIVCCTGGCCCWAKGSPPPNASNLFASPPVLGAAPTGGADWNASNSSSALDAAGAGAGTAAVSRSPNRSIEAAGAGASLAGCSAGFFFFFFNFFGLLSDLSFFAFFSGRVANVGAAEDATDERPGVLPSAYRPLYLSLSFDDPMPESP